MKTHYLFPVLLPLVPALVQAEVKFVESGGFSVENTATVNKSPQQVWTALVDEVDNWWPKDHSWWGENGTFRIDPQAGGCFCETYENNSAEHMHVTFAQPAKLLRMTGGLGPLQGMGMYGALDWSISQTDKDQSQIVLTYTVSGVSPSGFKEFAPVVDKVQAMQLQGLVTFLQTADKASAD